MPDNREHKFLIVTDNVDDLEDYRDWLNLYVQALQKTNHKADFGQVDVQGGKVYFYMLLEMYLTDNEMGFIEQMNKS